MQGRQAGIRLLWKIGRGFLASSHAGTRLPIAALPARAQGAPPQPAPGGPRGAGCCFRRCTSLPSQSKKQRAPERVPAVPDAHT
ncbi:hypothetical protein HMPREF1545_04001 [Oscillibacter sp. KLE 1728]|nr:hypothetical protein HMPREF1545_04001 [Oscillibacter sp. KLE 1728]